VFLPGERSRERRGQEVEGHAVRDAAGRCRRVGEYSTEVQQLTRARAHLRGRVRTVTCTDGRGWTCCRQMACKRSGVRISLAPPGQMRNSNRSNSEYSGKVQQRRPDGPPYVCSDRASSSGWDCWQDTEVAALDRRLIGLSPGQIPASPVYDPCHLVATLPSRRAVSAGDCCRLCKWPGPAFTDRGLRAWARRAAPMG
jgi:hypothetical protein